MCCFSGISNDFYSKNLFFPKKAHNLAEVFYHAKRLTDLKIKTQ